MAKKPTKSETLTIRLDQKMRFALEFIARVKGQSITTVVERAVKQAADDLRISEEGQSGRTWLNYWSVSEGVRAIRLALDQETNTSFEEDEQINFVRSHWPFFSDDEYLRYLRQTSIDIIWPNIASFVSHWREAKSRDRLATGHIMQNELRAANAWVPRWPQSDTENDPTKRSVSNAGKPLGESDGEIPF